MTEKPLFDNIAAAYDRWYDSAKGQAIFNAELDCLRTVAEIGRGRWLEVGTGTGRFAAKLGIVEGIDPSPAMLAIAQKRGITVHEGYAEALPFADASFDGLLMALSLCFIADGAKALSECRRVLRPGGLLLVGIVPAESPWGRFYQAKAAAGHPAYSHARFCTAAQTIALARSAGFSFHSAAGTLFWPPDTPPPPEPCVRQEITEQAGFLSLLFTTDSARDLQLNKCGKADEGRRCTDERSNKRHENIEDQR